MLFTLTILIMIIIHNECNFIIMSASLHAANPGSDVVRMSYPGSDVVRMSDNAILDAILT